MSKADEEVYCVCRKPHGDRFMIGCESCEEWYHGECINLTELEGKHFERFVCAKCQDESNPRDFSLLRKDTGTEHRPVCAREQCCRAQAKPSKYCCTGCANQVGKQLLQKLLTIQKGELPSAAAELDRSEIQKYDQELRAIDSRIAQVKTDSDNLGEHIKATSTFKRKREDIDDQDTIVPDDPEALVDCITCGKELQVPEAHRHIHKCFRKTEVELLFTSKDKSVLPGYNGEAFCNKYSKNPPGYCKKIHNLCVLHGPGSKPIKKGTMDQICGYPFKQPKTGQTLSLTDGSCCVLPKRNCVKHSGWEHLLRGDLTLETVSLYLTKQYVNEQKAVRSLRQTRRSSALGMAFHETKNHSAAEANILARDSRTLWKEIELAEARDTAGTEDKHNEVVDAATINRDRATLTGGSLSLPRRHWR